MITETYSVKHIAFIKGKKLHIIECVMSFYALYMYLY